SNDGVPKENFPSMLYDNEVPLNLLCDVSGFTPTLQSAFTANQLNDSPTTSTDIALSDNMFNSSYLEFEENQFAPIMRGQKMNSLHFIPYDVNPANRSIRKKSKTKIKKPQKPSNCFIIYRNEKLPEVMKKYPNITQGKASKIIGEMWSIELSEERLNFENKAKEANIHQQKPKGI
ncbi:1759_t:CDS:1, partial [Dentiscutata heterogama]